MGDVEMNIMNERRGGPIDRNPSMKCECCGTAYKYQDYWEPRWLLRDRPDTGETICDECQAELQTWHGRFTRNHQLTDFDEASAGGEA